MIIENAYEAIDSASKPGSYKSMKTNHKASSKQRKRIIGGLSPKKKAEKCFSYAQQAWEEEDHEAVFDYAMQGLQASPKDYELYYLAVEAVIALREPEKTYACLAHAWKHSIPESRDNLLVLGHLAVSYKRYTLAEKVLTTLLENNNPNYSGKLGKRDHKAAQRLLEQARLEQRLAEQEPRSRPKDKAPHKPKEKHPPDKERGAESAVPQASPKPEPSSEMPAPEIEMRFSLDSQQLQSVVQQGRVSSEDFFNLALWAYRLSFRSSFDQLLCLALLSDVQSFWYQEETARKVMKDFRGRAILADEVGLGKTIEACLVLKEYILRGLVHNALILAPSALVNQWQEELSTKFGLSFVSSNDPLFKSDPRSFWQQPFLLVSIQTARLKRHFDSLTSRSFDMVIVDEAHHLKNRSTRNWKLINSIHKSFLLFLTATPVQNKLEELYNLITLLKPGHLSTLKAFKNEFVARGNPTDPRNREKLRQLLQEVMIRNTRSVAQINLPPRFANTIRVEPRSEETDFYAGISRFVVDQAREDSKDIAKMSLRKLLEAAGSSHFAALKMLERMRGQVPERLQSRISELIGLGQKIQASSKVRQVLDLAKSSREQKIVFVNSQATLRYLEQMFQRHNLDHVLFRGGMTPEQKQRAIRTFEQGCPILLSMDSGGEGHNLQFCRMLINYDLPWNPMQIEQRIGRIHRIGQNREVYIYNFCASGSLEDHILDILDRKINMFELVIGEMEMILGRISQEQEFGELLYSIWTENPDPEDREKAFASLGTTLKRAKTAYEKSKELDETLFQEDFGV